MRFKYQVFNGVLLSLLPFYASAATYEWRSGFAQGTVEYHIDDGNGNSLLISCPGGQPLPVSAKMTTRGLDYPPPKTLESKA